MKLFLLSAAAAALVFASPAAFAQEHHGHGNHGGDNHNESHAAAPAKPAAPARVVKPARAPRVATPTRSAPALSPERARAINNRGPRTNGIVTTTASPSAVYNNAVKNNNRNDRRDNNNNRHDNNRHDSNRNDNNRHDSNRNDNDRHDNNWRGNDSHHDSNRGSWQGRFDRRNVTAQHHYRYRGNSWRWPHGYNYQRWSFGMTLPSLFWGSNYWISDYSDYGLAYPPPGTVWVRYGADAILIDRYSGEILEVVYGQFY